MLRACWVVGLVVFTAFAIACGGGSRGSKPDPEPRAEGFEKHVTIDGLAVWIYSAGVGPVTTSQGVGAGEYLWVIVDLMSTDPAKKFEYKTWADSARVVDNLPVKCVPVTFPANPIGRTTSATVTSEKAVRDVLVFQKPVPNAQYLDIDLPAPAGVSKDFRFRVYIKDLKQG